mgnify:CR=1 FL=1
MTSDVPYRSIPFPMIGDTKAPTNPPMLTAPENAVRLQFSSSLMGVINTESVATAITGRTADIEVEISNIIHP